jgi:hypothetical protein
MEGDPSIYYLWLREHPEERAVAVAAVSDVPYLLPNSIFADEDDLTAAG